MKTRFSEGLRRLRAAQPLRRAGQGAAFGALFGAIELFVLPSDVGPFPLIAFPPVVSIYALWVAAGWTILELLDALARPDRRPAYAPAGLALLTFTGVLLTGAGAHVAMTLLALGVLWGAGLLSFRIARHRAAAALWGFGACIVLVGLAVRLVRPGIPVTPAAEAPNVVVVLVDTLRIDRLSLFDSRRDTTPNLTRLATESVFFRHAYTPSPWTVPSVASILTGLRLADHGVTGWFESLTDDLDTLPERFRAAGFRTFGSTANTLISRRYGFSQGFDVFWAPVGELLPDLRLGWLIRATMEKAELWQLRYFHQKWVDLALVDGKKRHSRTAVSVVDDFRRWLDATRDEHFFVYLHLLEPHAPYRAPPPFRGVYTDPVEGPGVRPPKKYPRPEPNLSPAEIPPDRKQRLLALYDEEVRATDAAIGEVVQELRNAGILDRTVLAIVSDHGEEFGDHGDWGHGRHVFDELVRGLALVRFPGGSPRAIVDTPVSLRGLPNLLLERAGLEPLTDARLPVPGRTAAQNGPVLAELHPFREIDWFGFAVVDDHWKLVRHGQPGEWTDWLFDRTRDPGERTDLSGEHPEVLEALAGWLERQNPTNPPTAGRKELDGETAEQLRALGYLQ